MIDRHTALAPQIVTSRHLTDARRIAETLPIESHTKHDEHTCREGKVGIKCLFVEEEDGTERLLLQGESAFLRVSFPLQIALTPKCTDNEQKQSDDHEAQQGMEPKQIAEGEQEREE